MRFSNFWFRGLERIQNIFISGEVATGKESKNFLLEIVIWEMKFEKIEIVINTPELFEAGWS